MRIELIEKEEYNLDTIARSIEVGVSQTIETRNKQLGNIKRAFRQ